MDVLVKNSLRDFDMCPPFSILVTAPSPASLLQMASHPLERMVPLTPLKL